MIRPQVRPLNVDGSLNLLGLETVRLIYFRNKMAGKNSQVVWSNTAEQMTRIQSVTALMNESARNHCQINMFLC